MKETIYITGASSITPLLPQKPSPYTYTAQDIPPCTYTETIRSACKEPDYKAYITDPAARRRMSRVVKMGLTAALQCLSGAGEMPGAIITATGLGCLSDTEKFLRTLIENKEELLNPTPFIQSTFNTVGSQIAISTKNMAYNNTYVHRGVSFESALLDGMMMLAGGEAKSVLVGSYEELTATSFDIQSRLGFFRKGGKAGEGAQFFLLSAKEKSPCILRDLAFAFQPTPDELLEKAADFLLKNKVQKADIEMLISGDGGNEEEFTFYDKIEKNFPETQVVKYKHLTGDYQTVSSFALWLGTQIMGKADSPKKILIYNHFRNINHTFILLESRFDK